MHRRNAGRPSPHVLRQKDSALPRQRDLLITENQLGTVSTTIIITRMEFSPALSPSIFVGRLHQHRDWVVGLWCTISSTGIVHSKLLSRECSLHKYTPSSLRVAVRTRTVWPIANPTYRWVPVDYLRQNGDRVLKSSATICIQSGDRFLVGTHFTTQTSEPWPLL